MDKYVIPLVEYFNNNGLKTKMSCQGHNTTNKSMYWILFDWNITEQDIINFQSKHLYPWNSFSSNGYFAQKVFIDSRGMVIRCWYYLAATIEAALEDLENWKNNADMAER